MEQLREMAPTELAGNCKLNPSDPCAAITGAKMAGFFIHEVDKDATPGSWKAFPDM